MAVWLWLCSQLGPLVSARAPQALTRLPRSLAPQIDEGLDNAGVLQGGRVAQVRVLPRGYLAQDAPHDLARARLRCAEAQPRPQSSSLKAGHLAQQHQLGKAPRTLAGGVLEELPGMQMCGRAPTLGRPGAQWITSGTAKAPICCRTVWLRSFLAASENFCPSARVTKA